MTNPSPLNDTIVAIATPLGEGGLGVIRLSGPRAMSIADQLFPTSTPVSAAPSHTLHHGWILDGVSKLDEAVAAIFRAPASYTGEDVVELSCHGSPAVLRTVVELCLRHGARQAKPGEFTERAYLNGKMDLAQAEAVADLIHAGSAKARRAAVGQLDGGLSRRLEKIRSPLIQLLAHLEANLDFVEEDIPPLSSETTRQRLGGFLQELSALIETSVSGRLLREGLRVALVGRPNVGKSSLFNALLCHDRAIVTDIPGTTRDTLEERTQWEGMPVVLIDTAGLRSGGDSVERLGQQRALSALSQADLLVMVADGAEAVHPEDRSLLQTLQGKTAVVALNKSDLPSVWTGGDLSSLGQFPSVRVSAKTGEGLSNLRQAVMSKLSRGHPETEDGVVVTNERHRVHLEAAQARLQAALAALNGRRSEESIGWDLREAVRALDRITGADVDADVLEAVFRQFCIGK